MKVTAEDIAQLLAAPPPRAVPAQVVRAARKGRGSWVTLLLGLAFGGLGLVFVTVFFPWRFWDDWRLARDGARTTAGVITEVTRTNLSINKTRVVEYGFRYTPDDGRPREGRCYTTGQRWSQRSSVVIRYLPAEPEVACAESARLSEGGPFGFMVLIFPVIGWSMVVWFVVARFRLRRLLRSGQVAEVDVFAVDRTTMTVNSQSVYRITLRGPGLQDGRPITVRRVNQPDVALAQKHLRDQQPVFVLFDPAHPARLLFPEALVGVDA